MNTRRFLSVSALLTVALILIWAGYYWGRQHGLRENTSQSTQSTEKKPMYWHDPMVPGQKFDRPGKSPFMDMELVPVYAESGNESDANAVHINPRMQQNLGIRIAEVRSEKLAMNVRMTGTVGYKESDSWTVQARSNGFVERLWVRNPYESVKKGQALVDLYVPEWIAVQEEYLATLQLQSADKNQFIEAARQRMRIAGMSDEQIQIVMKSHQLQQHFTIRAPADGVVTEIGVREAASVSYGTSLFRINDLRSVWIDAQIPESSVAQIRVGDALEIVSPKLGAASIQARLKAILPEVDPLTRTQKTRLEISNKEVLLAPGMFVNILWHSASPTETLTVASEAIIVTGTRKLVILAQNDTAFLPVEIRTGRESEGRTEILSGLSAGQKLVVSGQFLIDSEANLKGFGLRSTSTTPADAHAKQAVENRVQP